MVHSYLKDVYCKQISSGDGVMTQPNLPPVALVDCKLPGIVPGLEAN